jgi:hypothetical protein
VHSRLVLKFSQKNVKYETYSATDEVIVFFWRVLESFTKTEKAMFVKFIWGHSRLPDPAKGKKFTIQVTFFSFLSLYSNGH